MIWIRTLKNESMVLRRFTERPGPQITDDIIFRHSYVTRADLTKTKFVLTNTDNHEGSIAWAKIRGSNWCPNCFVNLDGQITQIIPWNYKSIESSPSSESFIVAFVNPGEFESCDGQKMHSKFGSVPWDHDLHGSMLDGSNYCVLTQAQVTTAMYILAGINWHAGSVDLEVEPECVFAGVKSQFFRK